MANTIYIDANRKNALVKGETTNNEYVYKLNTELLLPKGTSIQCQNSFINSKGITGGSIEIEDVVQEWNKYSIFKFSSWFKTRPSRGPRQFYFRRRSNKTQSE